MSGVINGTAPNPVRLAEMCEQLGNAMGRPSWLPVPDVALKAVLGEGASVVRICLFSCFFLFICSLGNRILLENIN
jgi:NAD dependent epimerase/dehydratase family enzyme